MSQFENAEDPAAPVPGPWSSVPEAELAPSPGKSIGEWKPILIGLAGGLLVGVILLRGGPSAHEGQRLEEGLAAHKTIEASEARVGDPLEFPARFDASDRGVETADRDYAALQQQVSEMAKKRLAQQLAELEAELAAASEVKTQEPRIDAELRTSDSSKPAQAAASAGETKRNPIPPSRGEATLGYWNALNDVIAGEAAMRMAPANVTAANAGGFIEARLQAGQFAVKAIRELDTTGIDADAAGLGKELAAWYQEEVELNERAKGLLGSSDIAARKGSAGAAWKAGEERHRRKCDEINRKGADLRTRLTRKYGLAFPALN